MPLVESGWSDGAACCIPTVPTFLCQSSVTDGRHAGGVDFSSSSQTNGGFVCARRLRADVLEMSLTGNMYEE